MKNKKKIKNAKGNNQKRHTIRRLMQRYKLEINDDQYMQLCNIVKKNGVLIEAVTRRVKAYEVMFMKKKIKVLYDKNRHTVVTALSPHMVVKKKEQ